MSLSKYYFIMKNYVLFVFKLQSARFLHTLVLKRKTIRLCIFGWGIGKWTNTISFKIKKHPLTDNVHLVN